MKPAFLPRLINHPFGDPGLYVGFRYQGRAMLFDLGRLERTGAPQLLRVSHAFVSHTHMDHFIGFDHLLRVFLARDAHLDLFGPRGIIDNVRGKLAGYTWNLVAGYGFTLGVHEVIEERMHSVLLRACTGFAPEQTGEHCLADGILYDSPDYRVRTAVLDHRIPCLAFALEEKTRLNIRPERLAELEVPAGRWLNELKKAVREGQPDDFPIRAEWRVQREPRSHTFTLGELRERLVVATRGQKLAYVVDTRFTRHNFERVCALIRGADIFYCESLFVDADRDEASKRWHLTARQAGTLARTAGVHRLESFHFSPRYDGNAALLRNEAQAAFRGEIPPDEPDEVEPAGLTT